MRHRLEKYPDDFTAHFQLGRAAPSPARSGGGAGDAARRRAHSAGSCGSAQFIGFGASRDGPQHRSDGTISRRRSRRGRITGTRATTSPERSPGPGSLRKPSKYLKSSRKNSPATRPFATNSPSLYLRQQKFAEAVEQFDQALAIDPSDAAARKSREAALSQAPTKLEARAGRRDPLGANRTSRCPAFTLQALDGKTWKLADLSGKIVVINLWATWCVPCRAELPEFQKLYDQLKDRPDVAVISFNVDDDQCRDRPLYRREPLHLPGPARERTGGRLLVRRLHPANLVSRRERKTALDSRRLRWRRQVAGDHDRQASRSSSRSASASDLPGWSRD